MTGGCAAYLDGASSVLPASKEVVALPFLKCTSPEPHFLAARQEKLLTELGGYESFLRGLSGRIPRAPNGSCFRGGRARVSLMQTRAGVIREARASLDRRRGVAGVLSPKSAAGILALAQDLTTERSRGRDAASRPSDTASDCLKNLELPAHPLQTCSNADVADPLAHPERENTKTACSSTSSLERPRQLQLARRPPPLDLVGESGSSPFPKHRALPGSEQRTPKALQASTSNCTESPDHAAGTSAAEKCRSRHQREACESLRLLFFGYIGNESWPEKDKHLVFEQCRGTDAEMQIFAETFDEMDANSSADIDFSELLEFFANRKADVLLGMRIVRYLLSMPGAENDVDDKRRRVGRSADRSASRRQRLRSACTCEDMMRLVWLKATDEDVASMMMAFHFLKLRQIRAKAPPLISRRCQKELVDNFHYLDTNGLGRIWYADLVDAGLGNPDTVRELQNKHNHSCDGKLDCREFVQMFCPHGFRANADVRQAVMQDGQSMSMVTCEFDRYSFAGWLMESALNEFRMAVPELPLCVGNEGVDPPTNF